MATDTEGGGGTLLLRGARAVLPDGIAEGASLLVEGGRVARLFVAGEAPPGQADESIDLGGLTLYPGFIDVHIHGAVGVDVTEASADELHAVSVFLAERGVTSWLPTLVPAPAEDYRRAARAVEQLIDEQEARPASARALGLHYEGPFVNTEQCGALRTQFFRTFKGASDIDALATVERAGAVHMTTLAPEIEGGVELIGELQRRGWVVSIGHTRAGIEVLERARAAGARHMTHFLNAMLPLHHRAPGPIGWGLLTDDVTCDVIADGIHSDPLVLQLVLRCKGASRVALISDAVAPTGLGDGVYRVWGETIRVNEGRTSNERGSIAGSVITMLEAVGMCARLGQSWPDIARMAAANPARLLGLDSACGSIEEGKRADLTTLDAQGRVRHTLVNGRLAFRSNP